MEVELRFEPGPTQSPALRKARWTTSADTHKKLDLGLFSHSGKRPHIFPPLLPSSIFRHFLIVPKANSTDLMTSLPHRAARDMSDSDSDSDVASSAGSIMEDISEPDTTSFKCLFCESECSSVDEMFTHCESTHKFPIRETIKNIGSRNGLPPLGLRSTNQVHQNWRKLA